MEFRKGVEVLTTERGEKIEVKKSSLFGWGVVHPYKNEDGTWNWTNLIAGGSWLKLLFLMFIILVILFALYDYSAALRTANECFIKLNQFRILP